MLKGVIQMKSNNNDCVCVFCASNSVQVRMMQDLLQQEGIASILRYPGISGYAEILCGYTNLGVQLLTSLENEARAKELIAGFCAEDAVIVWPDGYEPEEDEELPPTKNY